MSNLRTRFFSVTASVLISGLCVLSATAQEGSGGIQQMMSPEEFRASGLNKLSAKELASLNGWLQGYSEATIKKAESRAARVKMDLIVSRIDGPFLGLSGSSIVKLQDGTKWKQANSGDRYQGPGGDNLGVVVMKAGLFGYRMRIEGTPEFYVDQLR